MSHYDPSQLPQSQRPRPNAQAQTEWQQPLPQQPIFQQSFQSPQPPRPPKKKARKNLWITIVAVASMLALLGVAFGVQNRSPQPAISTLSSSSAHRPQPTLAVNKPSPQPTLILQAIGKPVVVDSIWTVTVNGVKTSTGDPFSTPGAGDVYLVVDVTVKNTSTHYQDMSSGIQLVLKDSAGQQYRETITDFATPPDGSIKFGELLRGQLAYEIPATAHSFAYYFQADSSGTDLTEWALKV